MKKRTLDNLLSKKGFNNTFCTKRVLKKMGNFSYQKTEGILPKEGILILNQNVTVLSFDNFDLGADCFMLGIPTLCVFHLSNKSNLVFMFLVCIT